VGEVHPKRHRTRPSAWPASPPRTSPTRTSPARTFYGAHIDRAILCGADLTSAELGGTDFTDSDLTGAIWPSDVVAPDGWQREKGSDRLKRLGTNSDGPAAE